MLVGKKLKDRYHIYDRLGVGGAATVYLGRDSKTGQMVIIKVVHSHLVNDQFIGRFQREIDLLTQINTPHIIKLYDWALQEFDPNIGEALNYIVAEFVEGHTLADIVDTQGALDEPTAMALAWQIATGLKHIHNMGVVHRDIKSQNIMITPDNKAKIIDFGIAKGESHATLTLKSHFAGTLYYAPPEQILEAHTVDHRADLYALGVVMYEMLTASLPVKAREMGTVASKIIAGDLDPITGVSEPVEDLITRLLATRVEHRPSSASEVIQAIDAILGGEQEAELPERPPSAHTMTMRLHQEDLAAYEEEGAETVAMDEPPPPPDFVLVSTDGRRLPLLLPETVIGRSHPRHVEVPDIDLVALGIEEARTVSRSHCRIFLENGQYFLEDMGSMNGTYLNGDQLEASVPYHLTDGDQIAAGRVKLVFQLAT